MPRARGRRFKPAARTIACVGGSRADSQPPVMSNWLNNQAWLEWNLKCERGSFSEYFGSVLHNCTLTIKLGAKRGLDLFLHMDICLLSLAFGLNALR